jgi:hypothetical protein
MRRRRRRRHSPGKRRFRECAVDRDEERSVASEVVMHRGDAVGPNSKVGVAGSDTLVPDWSKWIHLPSDVIASIQPWIAGSSGKTSPFVNGLETNTMSRSPSGDAR